MKNYLKMLREDIHTTVVATVDENGHPVTRVIDIMLADGKTVYFITANGKAFYRQLMEQKFISVSGFCGGEGMDKKEASIHTKAVSVRETARNITGCGKCIGICPQKCIDTGHIPFQIRSENCLHCGNCMEACPAGAVEYKKYKKA